MPGPSVISFAGAPAVAAGDISINDAGQPTRRFLKDIVAVGKYQHPATGQDFEITPAWLDNAASQFSKMVGAGVKVPVPAGHSFKAEDNRGYVREMFREGDKLVGVIEMIGDDAIRMAGRNEVSLYAEPEFRDGRGDVYPWAIQHVALTPVPVIPGQDAFRAIAASRDGTSTNSVPVYRLATKGNDMEMLMKLSAKLGIDPAGKTEEQLWAAVMDAAGGPKPEMETEMKAIAASRDELQAKVAELESKLAPDQPSPVILKLARKTREMQIDKLCLENRINAVEAEGLKAIWIGDDKALALSATLDTANDARFDALLDLYSKREPIRPVGHAIGASRTVPDDNGYDPKILEEMSKHSRFAPKSK